MEEAVRDVLGEDAKEAFYFLLVRVIQQFGNDIVSFKVYGEVGEFSDFADLRIERVLFAEREVKIVYGIPCAGDHFCNDVPNRHTFFPFLNEKVKD